MLSLSDLKEKLQKIQEQVRKQWRSWQESIRLRWLLLQVIASRWLQDLQAQLEGRSDRPLWGILYQRLAAWLKNQPLTAQIYTEEELKSLLSLSLPPELKDYVQKSLKDLYYRRFLNDVKNI
ncbi:hypothetical protein D3A95_04250 [Thermosynechococcus sichuanensis E542]|uniref:Uncharacterized protein n=1 Tax=Thermosynechococcus sichuanensis E542 TaxID=2016101 RepID=A0A3B7ME64_9CYAN|nr:hypothetical protein [Thermosynechococcus vestitus]AXY67624.1 hypothetical protein D3A95_04250 [Thermosynechococcus vestitus E542]